MVFREETYKENGQIIKKYYIDDKEVSQNAYYNLFEELYENTKLKGEEHLDEICNCEDCQYLLDLIRQIKQLSDKDAYEILRDEIDFRVQEAYMEGQRVLTSELCNSLLKYSVRLEDELENLYQNGNIDEYEDNDS